MKLVEVDDELNRFNNIEKIICSVNPKTTRIVMKVKDYEWVNKGRRRVLLEQHLDPSTMFVWRRKNGELNLEVNSRLKLWSHISKEFLEIMVPRWERMWSKKVASTTGFYKDRARRKIQIIHDHLKNPEKILNEIAIRDIIQ